MVLLWNKFVSPQSLLINVPSAIAESLSSWSSSKKQKEKQNNPEDSLFDEVFTALFMGVNDGCQTQRSGKIPVSSMISA